MSSGLWLLIGTFFVIAVVLIIVVLNLIQRQKRKEFEKEVQELDKEKNVIVSTPVMAELSKVEAIVKNDKMEEKYKRWQKRFEEIKNNRITKLTDMIVDLELSVSMKDYKTMRLKLAKTEMEIYKVKTSADHLLGEIQEITVSEEKYRSIITKLKAKYRELNSKYQDHKSDYDEIQDAIDLQFENIERRFADFEEVMENNEYNEVVHVVKALDTMIDHMSIVIDEVPNLVLLGKQLIPKRIEEITSTYETMVKDGYVLDYLNIPYNMEEALKNVKEIIDRVKVLNLEECMFELKTMLDYLDSLFHDFEKEKLSRKLYEENALDFDRKLKKINKIVSDIYEQMDDIKNMYDLSDDDIKDMEDVRMRLLALNKSYQELLEQKENKQLSFTKLASELEVMSNLLKQLEEDLDQSLKSLGSMYDDEVRAREQLNEIQELLKECKLRIRSYKLPIITNNYFVELAEANEAILEIIKELEKKPIVIKVLNTRVDTARDLVLKLYHTTNEMIKTAQLAERAIVYGNRYRSNMEEIDRGLTNAEMLFYKGNYKGALETSINTIDLIDSEIHEKLLNFYGEG